MRSNLEIFLLALVQAGTRTPYELMSKADISLGSSLPALNRLKRDGFLRVSSGPARGSRVFTITPVGKAALVGKWSDATPTAQNDIDCVLRTAAIVWNRAGKGQCSTFLKRAAAALETKLSTADNKSLGLPTRNCLPEQYRWMRKSIEIERRRTEVTAILDLARQISASGKRGTGSREQRSKRRSLTRAVV